MTGKTEAKHQGVLYRSRGPCDRARSLHSGTHGCDQKNATRRTSVRGDIASRINWLTSAAIRALVFQEPLVAVLDAFLQRDARTPAERVQFVHVQELARRPVRLRRVK